MQELFSEVIWFISRMQTLQVSTPTTIFLFPSVGVASSAVLRELSE
jgi:hypothetical protein